jgi:hypothetical protein
MTYGKIAVFIEYYGIHTPSGIKILNIRCGNGKKA